MMAPMAQEIAKMVDMLPEQDQNLAYELVRRLVLAWDPDYTKVTPEEKAHIQKAEESGFISEQDIDWNHLEQYAN